MLALRSLHAGSVILAVVLLVSTAHASTTHDFRGRGRTIAKERLPTRGSVDIAAVDGGRPHMCAATPVDNRPTKENPKNCRVALFTAAHCLIDHDYSDPKRYFRLGNSIPLLRFNPDQYRFVFREGYEKDPNGKTNGSYDTALVYLTASCQALDFLKPVELAPVDENGQAIADVVFAQKRHRPTPRDPETGFQNVGGGTFIRGDRIGSNSVRVDRPTSLIKSGDSGSGLYDSEGRLVGAISGSSDSNHVGNILPADLGIAFSPGGITWVRQLLGQDPTDPIRVDVGAPPRSSLAASTPPATRPRTEARPFQGPASPLPKRVATPGFTPIVSGSSRITAVGGRPVPGDAIGYRFNNGRIEWQRGTGSSPGNPGAGNVPQTAGPLNGKRYLHNGQWQNFIPLESNVVAINNTPVPRGAVGYQFDNNEGVHWVFDQGQRSARGPASIGTRNPALPSLEPKRAPKLADSGSGQPQVRAARQPDPGPPPTRRGGTPQPATAPSGTKGLAARGPSSVSVPPSIRRELDRYEKGKTYIDGDQRQRYGYPDGVFSDVPEGGTGKLILAYFGNRNPALEAEAARQPLVEVRRYPIGSKEHQHARLFGVQALGIDGLGRKITRYAMPPSQALRSLINSGEPQDLQKYLAARNQLAALQHKEQEDQQEQEEDGPTLVSQRDHGKESPGSPALPTHEPIQRKRPSENAFGSVRQKCNSCHVEEDGLPPAFPAFTEDEDQWATLIQKRDPVALDWLKKFNSKAVHGEMVRHAGYAKESGAGKRFVDWIAYQYEQAFGKGPQPTRLGSVHAEYMIDPRKKSEYLKVLRDANITDPEMRQALLEFDAVWDSVGNPQWSWAADDGDSGRQGQKPLARTTPPRSTQSWLFQLIDGVWRWREPFDEGFAVDGNTRGIKRFVTVRFPRDAQGRLIRGTKGTETLSHSVQPSGQLNGSPTYRYDSQDSIWGSFPEGTKLFEVSYTEIGGKPVPIDVLVREKKVNERKGLAMWKADALRQDSDPAKVAAWVRSQPNWKTDPEMQAILSAVSSPQRDQVKSDIGPNRDGKTFLVNGQRSNTIPGRKSVIPRSVSTDTLARMYRELPMESSAGSRGWAMEPSGLFSGTHRGIPIDSQTCANCHTLAGEPFRDIVTASGFSYQGAVRAYGNGPGYDGVLSAPWFSQEALSDYGKRVRTDMRPEWAKFFENYSQARHDPALYRRTQALPLSNHPLRSRQGGLLRRLFPRWRNR